MIPKKEQLQLIDDIASFHHDPYNYVNYIFPWGSGSLEKFSGLEPWQTTLLKQVRDDLNASKKKRNKFFRYAVRSGHGIGKSATFAMLSNWGLSTCPDTRIVITANTEKQLLTKTMPEINKWFKLALNSYWFKYNATSISIAEKGREKNWCLDALPWSANNLEAFAGLHNQGRRIIIMCDEASGIDDKVFEVIEGACTDEDTEILLFLFGNPTKNTGYFSDAGKKLRHLFFNMSVDSREVSFTNKESIQEQIDTYGLDSDRIRVRILGQEPKSNIDQFIPQFFIEQAKSKLLPESTYNFAPKIIGCDPAWSGGDEIVIVLRQGLNLKVLERIPKNDNDILIAEKLARYEDEHNTDAGFIDLGYGTGIFSALKHMNRKNWQLVSFAEKSLEPGYLNKRAEMYGKILQYLKDGGSLPNCPDLWDELAWIESYYRDDGKIQLISKEDIKKEFGRSPNIADAFALTFAKPVRIKEQNKPDLYKRKLEFSSNYNNYNVFS